MFVVLSFIFTFFSPQFFIFQFELQLKDVFVKEPFQESLRPPADLVPSEDVNNEPLLPNVQQLQKKSSIFKSRFASNQGSSDSSSLMKKESLAATKGRKGLALYRHKWNDDDARKEAANPAETSGGGSETARGSPSGDHADFLPSPWDDICDEPLTELGSLIKVPRPQGWTASSSSSKVPSAEIQEEEELSVLSLKCARKVKDYYTVVRNVKKAHQIQESGEFQEFNDDVDYILDALQAQNPTATRSV